MLLFIAIPDGGKAVPTALESRLDRAQQSLKSNCRSGARLVPLSPAHGTRGDLHRDGPLRDLGGREDVAVVHQQGS